MESILHHKTGAQPKSQKSRITNKTKKMKTFKFLSVALLIASASIFSSCAKEGPAGPAGADGKDGNANVKSNSYFITGSEWTYSSGEATLTKQMSQITQDMVNNGVVAVYVKSAGSSVWEAMPTSYASTTGVVLSLGYSYEVGKLHLFWTWNTTATIGAADIGNNDFKVVVISGSALARHPNVNVRDYQQVEAIIAAE